MVWSPIAPDGSKSVKDNRSILGDNTTYTETTMNKDHYWNIGADEDGHHRFVQMPESETGGTPSNPSLAIGMNGVVYAKKLLAADAVAQQDVQPFYLNKPGATDQVMQLLGIRAMCVFDVNGAGVITQVYSHNVTVTRTLPLPQQGFFTGTFTVNLPSENYLVLGSCVRGSTSAGVLSFEMNQAAALATVKTTSFFKFRTILNDNGNNQLKDPLQCWFVVFGG